MTRLWGSDVTSWWTAVLREQVCRLGSYLWTRRRHLTPKLPPQIRTLSRKRENQVGMEEEEVSGAIAMDRTLDLCDVLTSEV